MKLQSKLNIHNVIVSETVLQYTYKNSNKVCRGSNNTTSNNVIPFKLLIDGENLISLY